MSDIVTAETEEPHISWDLIDDLSRNFVFGDGSSSYSCGWRLVGTSVTRIGKADWLTSNYSVMLLQREADHAYFEVTLNGQKEEVLSLKKL